MDIFGSWVESPCELTTKFKNAEPFSYITINNFLTEEIAEQIYKEFPSNDLSTWHYYKNPLEVKYAFNDMDKIPSVIKKVFDSLSSPEVIEKITELTGIKDLESDTHLHGSGLHVCKRGGRLAMHLDYEKHPLLDKIRKINLILYLSKGWQDKWGGGTVLTNKERTNNVVSNIEFNKALIFKTDDTSWHGFPDPITCPEGETRNSIAFYYLVPRDENIIKDYRVKANYYCDPTDVNYKKVTRLAEIRKNRRITQEDIDTIFPEWNI